MALTDRLRRLVPGAASSWWRRTTSPVAMGDLRRFEPVSRLFGADRGLPLCRHYIEAFLANHADHIRGRVLEVSESTYTTRFGADRVRRSEVLHATTGNASATIVGDLATGEGLSGEEFDTLILTQVLQCIFDVQGAAQTIRRILAPGGTAFITVPAIAPVSRYDVERWGEYWHFGEQAMRRLFEPLFGAANVDVAPWGNAIVAHAYIAGMSAAELTPAERAYVDPDYPIVITAFLRG